MSKQFENMATEVVEETLAKIIKEDDGFHVVDADGTVGPVCKLVDEGEKTIALTSNVSNRKWFNKAKAEAEIAEKGYCELTFKASKVYGSQGPKLPNAKLISYLSEEEQAEYKAIIDRAIAAKDADKKKPLTEKEKLQAQIERAKAKLAQLEEDAAQ